MRNITGMVSRYATMVALIGTLAPAAVSAQGMSAKPAKDIVAVATEAGSFTTLLAAVKAAGLVETLQGAGPYTVFAPTDAAFAKLPAGTVEALLKDREKLTAILTYHVLAGKVESGAIVKAGKVNPATVEGEKLDVRVMGGKVMVNSATVVKADVQASNGVIHVIDTVLLPPSASAKK
jgi:uncharacterized surface protein with fasciclin (FAS1) repeats